MGRILARALLCENPKDGEACDTCPSCEAMIADRNENFLEVDAATNSGKEHVKRITEEAQFGSFSGGRKLYLFDECFTEDTMLMTPKGPRSIKDLVEQRYDGLVASLDSAGNQCWKPVTNWYVIEGERECVTLEFDNDVVLTVTIDQEIFTKNRGWVQASKLTADDDICEATLASLAKTGVS
jgi:DNA polymerase-3 subunit gamma/tau